jgi:hypothetical protein
MAPDRPSTSGARAPAAASIAHLPGGHFHSNMAGVCTSCQEVTVIELMRKAKFGRVMWWCGGGKVCKIQPADGQPIIGVGDIPF